MRRFPLSVSILSTSALWITRPDSEGCQRDTRKTGCRGNARQTAGVYYQAVEKYLKALLQELSIHFPKTHDLEDLLNLLGPHASTLNQLPRSLDALTVFAVEYRYPIVRASTRQMRAALRAMERARAEVRARLGLPP